MLMLNRFDFNFGSVLLFPLTLCGEEPATGFERIFDGKSFEGYTVATGALMTVHFIEVDQEDLLTYTVKLIPDDFEPRFEWKVSKGCNSVLTIAPLNTSTRSSIMSTALR